MSSQELRMMEKRLARCQNRDWSSIVREFGERGSVDMRQSAIWVVLLLLLSCLALVTCAREALPNTAGDGERTVPKLSQDGKYLLDLQSGVFKVTRLPGTDSVLDFSVQKGQVVEDFIWSPQSDAFAYHTRYEESGGTCGVYIVSLDGSSEKVADLERPDLGSRQMLWSPCGRYLFWDKPFSVYDRETGTTLVKSDIDQDYAFVRSPLFSNDSSKLAFTLFEREGPENLWVLDLEDCGVRKVTNEGAGDYPFFWVDDTEILVRIGAVSTGGGHVYGLAAIDLETGSRVVVDVEESSSNGVDGPGARRLNIAKSISPDGEHIVGVSRSGAGTESRIYVLELETGRREVILKGETPGEGYGLAQCLWTKEDQMLLSVGKESYDDDSRDSQDRYQIIQCSTGSGCHLLVESGTELSLLGVVDNRLYYVELSESKPLRSVPLEQERFREFRK